ncbi:MAG: hypothetical protein IPK08_09215 [Bacteroidetes bacterium]|nr:hypothetical protein [Bacteroidota bacterium]
MKRLNLPVLVTGLLICLLAVPQLLFSQVVKEKFDKLMLSENFDSINTYWTTLANAENLFIVQDGEYILQRKAQVRLMQ